MLLIDGATGTELERHGVEMVQGAWSGDAARTHPEALQAVHESHIRAGAELIIANTYASSRHLLTYAGLEEHFELLNLRGIEIALAAREAAQAPNVVVAGSLSTSQQGGDFPPIDVARRNFRDQAEMQAEAGAEILMLEMMRDIEQTDACLEAALSTGLPVWLGWSCHDDDGVAMLWNRTATLAEGMASIEGRGVQVVSIMHTEVTDVDTCLDVLDLTWNGPVGVYAHSGVFDHPNWLFNGVISEQDYCTRSRGWLERGVQVIGGCCGITDSHIATMKQTLGL